MGRTVLFMFVVLLAAESAYATWSVVALDRQTGTVVIASATCVPQGAFAKFPAKDLRDVQAIVVPGKAVAAAQASVDRTRSNQRLIFAELQKGTPPDAILAALKEDPRIASRQFGIVDMDGRSAGFSGSENGKVSLDRQGRVDGTEIYFSIQGNILTNEEVVTDAVRAFTAATGELTDRVMAAMEAADAKGGDSRCSCDGPVKVDAPCTAKTAHVAYMLKADRTDANGDSFNNGTYAMYLSVTNDDITPQEDANPVRTLRLRYDRWKKNRR
jgi:uncharacterized Ntn-hydrolase superfamily protein